MLQYCLLSYAKGKFGLRKQWLESMLQGPLVTCHIGPGWSIVDVVVDVIVAVCVVVDGDADVVVAISVVTVVLEVVLVSAVVGDGAGVLQSVEQLPQLS
jgi:hypothetical protein